MSTYTDIFSGNSITPAFPQYSAITLSGNITLSWPAQFQNTNNVVSTIMVISPTAGGFSVTMPDATQVARGFEFYINNPTSNAFNLLDNTGGLIYAVTGPGVSLFWLDSNLTQAGTWTRVPTGGGYTAVTSVNAASTTPNLEITGVPITTMGTITFALAQDLLALTSFGASTGIAARTAANAWSLRSIVGTANQITVIQGNGVAGDPTISLPTNISGLASIAVGNLSLSANQIISTNLNGPITLNPNGTGVIQLNKETDLASGAILKFLSNGGTGYLSLSLGNTTSNQPLFLPTTPAVTGQVLGVSSIDVMGNYILGWTTVSGGFAGPSTVNALARYSNITGGLKNSPVLLDDASNLTGITSAIVSSILIGGSLTPQTITTTAANANLIIAPNGVGALVSQGDIQIQPSSATQRQLKLFNTAGTFYAGLKSNAGATANVTWSLPAADSSGAFTSDGLGNLSITPFTGFVGPSTINAVARYSNISGTLKNSIFVITDAGAATGLVSSIIGNISLGITDNRTITTSPATPNLDLQISANGTGSVYSICDFSVFPRGGVQSTLYLYSTNATNFAGLKSNPAMTTNVTWTLPLTDGSGAFTSNGAGIISIVPFSGFAGPSVVNSVATFSNTTGTIQSSPFIITPGGAGTGLVSCVIGSMSLGITDNRTITTTTTNLNLQLSANGTGSVVSVGNFSVSPRGGLQPILSVYTAGGTNYNSLTSVATAPNVSWSLPPSDVNGLMSSNGAGVLTLNTGIIAQGTPNFNIGIGTNTFDATSSRSITFITGTLAASAPVNSLVFQSATTTSGTSIAWYGTGTGGVTSGSGFVANREIQVTVNGAIYYLLARNAP